MSRVERKLRGFESDSGRRASASLSIWLDKEKIVHIVVFARLKCFLGDWDEFVVNTYCEPMQGFENRCTVKRVLETARAAELRITIKLKTRKVEKKSYLHQSHFVPRPRKHGVAVEIVLQSYTLTKICACVNMPVNISLINNSLGFQTISSFDQSFPWTTNSRISVGISFCFYFVY